MDASTQNSTDPEILIALEELYTTQSNLLATCVVSDISARLTLSQLQIFIKWFDRYTANSIYRSEFIQVMRILDISEILYKNLFQTLSEYVSVVTPTGLLKFHKSHCIHSSVLQDYVANRYVINLTQHQLNIFVIWSTEYLKHPVVTKLDISKNLLEVATILKIFRITDLWSPQIEPILAKSSSKFITVSRHIPAHELWEKMRSSAWQVTEIKFGEDEIQLKALNAVPSNIININKFLHAFFVVADGLIGETTLVNLYNSIQVPDIRKVYAEQIAVEAMHAETYREIALRLCHGDLKEFEELCTQNQTIPSIQNKITWAIENTLPTARFAHQLVAQAIVEGIFFFSSFATITFFKTAGYLPGIGQANDLIQADETQHWETAANIVYPLLVNKLTLLEFTELITASVVLEKAFVRDYLIDDLPGLTANQMCEYVEFVADRMTQAFGYPIIYKTLNPFNWIALSSVPAKINFFDRTGAEYNVGETYVDEFEIDRDI